MSALIKKIKRLLREEQGNIIVITAMSMAFILGVSALVVDVGYLYNQKRHLQNTADAAALAGARELIDGSSSNVENKVNEYVIANGVGAEEIEFVGSNDFQVTVRLTGNRELFFAKVMGFQTADVSVSATASVGRVVSGKGVIPIGISQGRYQQIIEGAAGPSTNFVEFHISDYGSGNWGWLYFDETEKPAITVDYIAGNYPGILRINDIIHSNTGNNLIQGSREAEVKSILDNYIAEEATLMIPITTEGSGGKDSLVIVGFAHIILDGYDLSDNSNHQISGRVVAGDFGQGDIVPGEGGAFDIKGIALVQ